MLIFKRSFSDYMSEKLSEMAIPPTKFKNPKTGEFEGDYHVHSTSVQCH